MSKPSPEEFAKNVLWHLAGLHAQLSTLRVRIYMDQASRLNEGQDLDEFLDNLQAEDHKTIVAHQDGLYLQALERCGLSPGPKDDER